MFDKKLVLKNFSDTRYCMPRGGCEKNHIFLLIFPFQFGKIVLLYILHDVGERRTLMAKKFGKFLMVTAALGAVAAGAYYYLQKKDGFADENFDDDDDFDNFDDDLEEDTAKDASRNYVDLNLDKAEEFKEGIDAAKADTADKIVGAAEETAGKVKEEADKAKVKVEEFFDDEDGAEK